MKTNRITVELLLHSLAVLIAALLRASALGVVPLGGSEAELALQAFEAAQGGATSIGAEPGYVVSTGFLFFLLGSSTSLARLIPAVAGSLIVLVPYFSREWIGRVPALVLAFGLAFDPGFVALSRQASGTMLAVSCGVFAVVLWLNRRAVPAGIFTGLALISGPTIYAGLVGGVLTFILGRAFGLAAMGEEEPALHEETAQPGTAGWVRAGLLSGGGTILLAGTLFLRYPQGIGGMAAAIPAYFAVWFTPSGVPVLRQLIALGSYHPWVVLFGLFGAGAAWIKGDRVGRWLSIWAVIGLLIAIFPLGRQVQDLVWPLLPLWALAAVSFARQLVWTEEDGLTVAGLAALVFLFLLYAGLNLAAIARMPLDPQAVRLRWQLIAGALGLVGVSAILIGIGWSPLVGRLGMVWGGSLVLGLFTLSATWAVLDRQGNRAQELWYKQPSTVQEGLIMHAIGDLSEWSTGRRDGVEIVLALDSPSLRWSLRNYANLTDAGRLDGVYFPPLVISRQFDEPRLDENYRGTDFIWQQSPAWAGAVPENFLSWLIFREAPTIQEKVVLWARNDLFPDGDSLLPSGLE